MLDPKREEFIKSIIKRMAEQRLAAEHSKYGKFIIQTNEVQFYLNLVILLRTHKLDKKFKDYLSRLELGNLIGCFRVCARNSTEVELVRTLDTYKRARNSLAHKMLTNKKLTIRECELAIELGEELLKELQGIIKEMTNLKIQV